MKDATAILLEAGIIRKAPDGLERHLRRQLHQVNRRKKSAPCLPCNPCPFRRQKTAKGHRARRSLAPLEPVSSRSRWMLGLAFFALFVAVWAFFTWAASCRPPSWPAPSPW